MVAYTPSKKVKISTKRIKVLVGISESVEEARRKRTLKEMPKSELEEKIRLVEGKKSRGEPDLMGLPIVRVRSISPKPFLYKDKKGEHLN